MNGEMRHGRTGRPLLVSVSGDGGYNEVVDGTMQAGNDAAVCAVLPAGNANDHRRATREQPLADAIVTGSVTRIDLLRLTVGGSAIGTGKIRFVPGRRSLRACP